MMSIRYNNVTHIEIEDATKSSDSDFDPPMFAVHSEQYDDRLGLLHNGSFASSRFSVDVIHANTETGKY